MYLNLLNHTIFISLHSGPKNVWNSFSLLWHRRLGHLNRKSMSLLKKMSTGIDDNLHMRETCEDCVYGKQERTPFNNILFCFQIPNTRIRSYDEDISCLL